jgi:hypothetical protein
MNDSSSTLDGVRRLKRFLAFVYVPLAIVAALSTYQVGSAEAVWLDRPQQILVSWFCATATLVVFGIALWRRLRRRTGRHTVRGLLAVVGVALAVGASGGPILFVLFLVVVIPLAIAWGMVWLCISYWLGFEVPPMSFH